jgi:hypothetical protein
LLLYAAVAGLETVRRQQWLSNAAFAELDL